MPHTQALAQGEVVTDHFTYTVNGRQRRTSSTTLTITITGTNDGPVAVADTNAADAVKESGVQPGGNLAEPGDTTAAGNVLDNDTDVDAGATRTVSAVNGLAGNVGTAVTGIYGSVTIAADGSYTYTLDNGDPQTQALAQGEVVTDQFTYTVTDADGATSSTTLTITITGTNDAPVAVADTNDADAVTESGVNPAATWPSRATRRPRATCSPTTPTSTCRRDQDGFGCQRLGRQRRHRGHRHLRLGDDRRRRQLHLHARQQRSADPGAGPGRGRSPTCSPTPSRTPTAQPRRPR